MFRKIVLLAVLFVASAASTNVRNCTRGRPSPLAVNIEGCSTMPCDVIKGTTAVMNVHFLGTREDIKSISTQVRATTLGITVPYELPEETADVCANLMQEATCPIYKDEDVIYSFKFPIDSYYPEVSVRVEISLIDEATNESVSCFIADIRVRKGNSGSQYIS